MSITNEQIKVFIILAIIGTIIYMLIYNKKGQNRGVLGYFKALANCFTLTVVSMFIIFGVLLVKVCLTQPLYPGLIVPLGWGFIAYTIIKNILNNDFGLNIHIFNPKLKIIQTIKENGVIIPISMILIGFAFATFMIFFKALPDVDNQPYGPIPILLVGIIFLCATIGIGFLLYSTITKKIRFVPNNENSFNNKKTYRIEENFKNLKRNKLNDKAPIFILCIIILVGILFLILGLNINNNYREKSKNYIEVQGRYVESKRYETDGESGNTYSLIYSYEVNGHKYTVSTDYGTAFVPEKGTEKTILYNPNNQEEAVIKNNNSSILLFFLAGMFILIPGLVLGAEIMPSIKSDTIRKILGTLGNILIGTLFIAGAGGIYYMMCIGANDFSIWIAIKSAGFTIIFPIIFAGAGIAMICSTIYMEIKGFIDKRNNRPIE